MTVEGGAVKLEMTNRVDLALRALRALAAAPSKAPALAEALGTTVTYLAHVMRPLVAAGWVASATGPRGGYELTGEPSRISLLDLIEAVEGRVPTERCVLRRTDCSLQNPCSMHQPWARARNAMLLELSETTIDDLG